MEFSGIILNVFARSDVLHPGVYNAVANYNIGCQGSLNILKKAGIKRVKFCTKEKRRAPIDYVNMFIADDMLEILVVESNNSEKNRQNPIVKKNRLIALTLPRQKFEHTLEFIT